MTKNKRTYRQKLYSVWDVFWIYVDMLLSSTLSRLSLWWQQAEVGKDLRTSGRCYFKCRTAGSLILGEKVRFIASVRSNRVGMRGTVILETLENGHIHIGNNTGGSSVVISSCNTITIGNRVNLGGDVRIYDHDFHALDPEIRQQNPHSSQAASEPVHIGNDVFIGASAIILKGTTIGDKSIVGAGSVVTSHIPPNQIWAGNPAKMIKIVK